VPVTDSEMRRKLPLIFVAFVGFEVVLTLFGVSMGTGGHQLAGEAVKKLESMAQVFQTVSLLAVIACIAVTRARLTEAVVQTYEDLARELLVCLAVGEVSILLGIVGLAKLHLPEFLLAAGLTLAVDLGLILPRFRRLARGLDNPGGVRFQI